MRRIAAVRARLAQEDGYSLFELLTVMAILSIVLGAISMMLVEGSNAELEMNNRFQAQTNARLALDTLRREVHCASSISTSVATTVTLAMPSQCPTAFGQTSITWCTVASGSTYSLWRYQGGACSGTGRKYAEYLTVSGIFAYTAQSSTSLAKLSVTLPVNLTATTHPERTYTLNDDIVLRNSTRA